ncbi:MAG: hypothetical protein QMD22_10590 [archaeon]|nr:hypothetical protein [archaeon]
MHSASIHGAAFVYVSPSATAVIFIPPTVELLVSINLFFKPLQGLRDRGAPPHKRKA